MIKRDKLKAIEEANIRLLGGSKRMLKEDLTFETLVDEDSVEEEDGGMAKIIRLEGEEGINVTITSWDEDNMSHESLQQFIGHRIRVTIETID